SDAIGDTIARDETNARCRLRRGVRLAAIVRQNGIDASSSNTAMIAFGNPSTRPEGFVDCAAVSSQSGALARGVCQSSSTLRRTYTCGSSVGRSVGQTSVLNRRAVAGPREVQGARYPGGPTATAWR